VRVTRPRSFESWVGVSTSEGVTTHTHKNIRLNFLVLTPILFVLLSSRLLLGFSVFYFCILLRKVSVYTFSTSVLSYAKPLFLRFLLLSLCVCVFYFCVLLRKVTEFLGSMDSRACMRSLYLSFPLILTFTHLSSFFLSFFLFSPPPYIHT
jgi:hypothetical protein